jgi:hypothetical protein
VGCLAPAPSRGISAEDLRELTVWSPSADCLLAWAAGPGSISFHRLPSGLHCLSRTLPTGKECGSRTELQTQCLILRPAVLARFGNHPLALAHAALAAGLLQGRDMLPAQLDPVYLPGEAPVVDVLLLDRLAREPGPEWMGSLVQAAMDSVCMAVPGGWVEELVAGVLCCLPPACRLEFSFSTGTRFSTRRPFRVVALPGEEAEQSRMARLYNLAILHPDGSVPDEFTPVDSWPRLIQRVLRAGRAKWLARRLAGRQGGTLLTELNILGLELLEEFENDDETDEPELERQDSWHGRYAEDDDPVPPSSQTPAYSARISAAHAAHRETKDTFRSQAAMRVKVPSPSARLAAETPALLQVLEKLDDLVFSAIAGRQDALDELKSYWPTICHTLEPNLLAESREQYLRYALTLWNECLDPAGVRQVERAIQSLDVLCLLFAEG